MEEELDNFVEQLDRLPAVEALAVAAVVFVEPVEVAAAAEVAAAVVVEVEVEVEAVRSNYSLEPGSCSERLVGMDFESVDMCWAVFDSFDLDKDLDIVELVEFVARCTVGMNRFDASYAFHEFVFSAHNTLFRIFYT